MSSFHNKNIKKIQLFLAGFTIVLLRKNIKNMYLRMDAEGNFSLSAPFHYTVKSIKAFLESKEDWLKKQYTLLHTLNTETQPTTHSVLGLRCTLVIQEQSQNNRIWQEGEQLFCQFKNKVTSTEKAALLAAWQKQQMIALLPVLIERSEKRTGLQAKSWIIKTMKSRWGSCNIKTKRICLNLHLMRYPLICLEYVIIHELVHLLEPSHNRRFHDLMDQFMPEWKNCHKLLKDKSFLN